jgi:hypothetical protein
MTGMLRIAIKKKKQESAFVDIKNREGPIPIYLASSVVFPALHFESGRPPRGSQNPNFDV